ncbi:hypothetical protein H5410_006802 [Solanum commersonii]|uniref:acetyl-CoA carboxytransferase n=1 Tax=Solanum commersonii TaxID=4109 RepID=A0A9J6AAS5_SOLCO|nr:hypothetical protein H5410_006802 [Solanum commersonii]
MFGLRVPIITVATNEGGSGRSLAIECVNKWLMLENSTTFYVASPKGCTVILWKSSQSAPKRGKIGIYGEGLVMQVV